MCHNGTWNEGWNEGAGSQSFTAKPRREDDSWIARKAWTDNESVERMDLYCQTLECGLSDGWNSLLTKCSSWDNLLDTGGVSCLQTGTSKCC